jgi:hypothetical protein
MDGATIQARVYAGRGKAAQRIGLPCDVFRPINSTAPLTNKVARLNAAFNAADPKYLKPNLYNKPVWFADLDGRLTQPGDYLVRASDGATWFIADQQQLFPIVAISCNAQVAVRRQATSTTFGAGPYSGIVNPAYVLGTIDTLWPASILIGGRALAAAGLPADVKESGWRILLPPSVPITIEAGDRLDDDRDRSFWVESAELTDLGWRLTVNEAHA